MRNKTTMFVLATALGLASCATTKGKIDVEPVACGSDPKTTAPVYIQLDATGHPTPDACTVLPGTLITWRGRTAETRRFTIDFGPSVLAEGETVGTARLSAFDPTNRRHEAQVAVKKRFLTNNLRFKYTIGGLGPDVDPVIIIKPN